MDGVRRTTRPRLRALLAVLAVAAFLAVVAAPGPHTTASASTATKPAPAPMRYACALRRGGLLHFAWRPARCTARERVVPISPGPVAVCVHANHLAYRVASLAKCPTASKPLPHRRRHRARARRRLTLPPSKAPVYFCASKRSGALSYPSRKTPSHATRCSRKQFLVVVPVPAVLPHPPPVVAPPVLGDVETGALVYEAGTSPVPVTSSITVASPGTASLSGATVAIGAGFVSGQDVLALTPPHGITASYDVGTGVLRLTGGASAASYEAALRSVTYSDPGASATPGIRVVSFQVADGLAVGGTSNVVSRSVSVATPGVTLPGAGGPAASAFVAPVISNIETTPLSYQSKSTPVTITSALTLNDDDASAMAGATVSIIAGLDSGADTLGFTSPSGSGIIGSYNAKTGVLTLSGAASLADYQAALRSVTFATSDPSASPAARTVSFSVTDSVGATSTGSATRTIDVGQAPQPPVLANVETGALGYEAGTPAVPVTSSLTVSSPATTTLAGATVTISQGLAASEDALRFTSQNGISGSYNVATGVLTLSGTATTTDYQTALRSVTYADPNGTSPTTGSRTISFQVNDGSPVDNLSNVVSRTITVEANPPPVASPVTATTDKNTAITINVLASASDPDGDTLKVTSVNTTHTKGTVTVNANGTVTYDPNGQFQSLTQGQSATDTFDYTVSDNYHTTSATVTVTITGVNDPPVIASIEPGALIYQSTSSPAVVTSTLTLSDDDTSAIAGATVAITSGLDSGADVLSFTNEFGITGGYDASTGLLTLSGTATTTDYQAALRSVTFETTDPSASPAPRTVSFAVTDSVGATSAGTAERTIQVSEAAPVLSGIESGALGYAAGTPAVPVTSSLTVSSPATTTLAGATVTISQGLAASEDALKFTDQNGISGSYDASTGVLTLSGAATTTDYQTALRSVTYADSNGTSPTTGSRTVSFQVNDGSPVDNLSNVVSRTITVGSNSPPVAGNVSASTGKHTATDISVLANASDPDGDPLSVTSVNTTGTKGTVSINPDGTIHYDPNGPFNYLLQGQTATDTFGYTVSDGFHTASGTVTVTIIGANDPPVIANIETTPLAYQSQSPAVAVTSTLALSDDDTSTIAGATVSITSGFDSGADTLGFTSQNGITGSYNASTGVLTLSGQASLAQYQAALRSVTFSTTDPSASPAPRTVSFSVTDIAPATSTGTAERTIDVSPAPPPPTAVNHSYTAVGNTPLAVGTSPTGPVATVSGSLLNGDSDANPSATLSVTANTAPSDGTVTVNANGTFTYTPSVGFTGTDTFQYTIAGSNDPTLTTSATVTITVGPVVWYVNDSLGAAGNGTSSSPFNTLAAANSAAGSGSTVFLYQGNATYTGGVTMQQDESLFGQPHGLTADGYSLVAASGSAPTITNASGDGIDLAEGVDVEGVEVSSPSGNGIAASGVNDATVGAAAPVGVSGAGGDGIHVSGGSGTLDFASASVTGSAGHSIFVTDRTSGAVSFGGDITDSSAGIVLSSNTGATVSFSGALTLDTGTNTAFAATGGGTVTATGSGSTVTTTTGTALDVVSTTIGAGGLTFEAVSSDGADPGIDLSSTGTAGGLTVTGTGAAGSGGTIQNSTGNGITLSSTTSPSFTDMVIKNNAADGINGSEVDGLTLADSKVSGNGTQANVSGENDDGLDFSPNGTGSPNGLTGTVSITGSTIIGSADNNAIISDSSGTLDLTATADSFSSDNATTGNDGLHIDANGSANATVSVTGSTFANNYGDHFQFSTGSASTGTDSVTFSNNVLDTTASGVLGGGVVISPFGNAHTTITVDGNSIQNSVFSGIVVDENGTTGTVSGTIDGNTIGTTATTNSGSKGDDIGVFAEGSVTETLAITNNNLYQYDNLAGIYFIDREGNPTMNLTITGNTIADPGTFGSWGLYGNAGALSTDNGTVCAAISGNSLAGSAQSGQGGYDLELDQFFGTTIKLAGYTGTATDAATVESFLGGANNGNGTPTVHATTSGSGGGFPGATSCPAP